MRTSARSSFRHLAASWLGLVLVSVPTASFAQLPEHTFELRARTALTGSAYGTYAIAPGNLLPGSPALSFSNERDLAFLISVTPEGRSAVWFGASGGLGARIFLLPAIGDDARIGEIALGPDHRLAFTVSGASNGADDGIYLLDTAAPATPPAVVKVPPEATSWTGLRWSPTGTLGGRATVSGGRAYVVLTPSNDTFTATWLAKETNLDASSPYQFLYTPSMSPSGDLAGIADVGPAGAEYHQELRIFGQNGSTSRASTRGLDPTSPVYRFSSVAPASNAAGQVAFLGVAKSPTNTNVTTLWLEDGAQLRVLAQSGAGDVKELEFFPPAINASGLVAFRAIDTDGLRAIWITDGEHTKRVVREHDLLPSDRGPARVNRPQPANPVFAGMVSINDDGDLAFVSGLTSPDDDQEDWGTAVWVARAPGPDAGPDAGPIGDAGDAGTDASVDAGAGPVDGGRNDGSPSDGDPGRGAPNGGGSTDDAGAPLANPVDGPGAGQGDGCDCRMVGSKTPLSSLGLVIVAWLARSRRRRANGANRYCSKQ